MMMNNISSDNLESLFSLEIRPASLSDVAYIASTYCRTMQSEYKDMHPDTYNQWSSNRLDNLIANSIVLVAHPPDEPNLIVGYGLFSESSIHFVYVRKPYRRTHTAKRLVSHWVSNTHQTPPFTITHITNPIRTIKANDRELFTYIPY